MPNKQKHVFPIILDAPIPSTVASGNVPVDTSYVLLAPASGDVSFTVPDGTIPGQMLTLINTNGGGNDANVTFTTARDSNADLVRLDNPGEMCTAVWTTDGWQVIAAKSASTVA